MKKCHICGTTRKNDEKTNRELDEEWYCDFCIDENGKPRSPNPVRSSILRFWRERDIETQESNGRSN